MSLVTWMIPVLNGMPYLPLTLQSIEQQTFKDFQVVIWDNGSTDGTVEEARRWIPSRLPGEVIADRPLPLGLARAAMVNECQTEFGALIDADDLNHPTRLEQQMDFLKSKPEISVLGTQLWRIDSAGINQGPFSDYPLIHEHIIQQMLLSNPIGQPSVCFRRTAVLEAGNYQDVKVEDYELWLRMASKGFRFANLPQRLVDYRVHERSTTQQQVAADQLDRYVLDHLMSHAPDLFGCSSETMRQLRLKQSPWAAPALVAIARHLGDEKRIFRSPVFNHAVQQMIGKADIRTRAIVAYKSRGVVGATGETGKVLMDIARYIRDSVFGKRS